MTIEENLQNVLDIWRDRRYDRLTPAQKVDWLVAKATQGQAFVLSHEDYIKEREACAKAAEKLIAK